MFLKVMILLNNWSQVCEKSICQGSFLIKLLVYFPSNITWELYILQNTSFSENVKFTVGAHFFLCHEKCTRRWLILLWKKRWWIITSFEKELLHKLYPKYLKNLGMSLLLVQLPAKGLQHLKVVKNLGISRSDF